MIIHFQIPKLNGYFSILFLLILFAFHTLNHSLFLKIILSWLLKTIRVFKKCLNICYIPGTMLADVDTRMSNFLPSRILDTSGQDTDR